MLEEMRREARANVQELLARVRRRNQLKAELGVGPRPHKYVIVATGNIYDDVEQARAAAQAGADVIAVIRSTAQSLLDYVPHGATTEGYGGTYATQENFRIMREALDEESRRLRRYVQLTNYSSGLCMPEIAFAAAWERLDMLLNDAMYGILFRDINMRRTFVRSVLLPAHLRARRTSSSTPARTTTSPPPTPTRRPTPSSPRSSSTRASPSAPASPTGCIGLGHSFEIDPAREDTLAARARAGAARPHAASPRRRIKYMPPTKHKQGDIFFSHAYDVMADLVGGVDGAGDPAPRHDDRGDAQPAPHGSLRRAEERRLRVPGRRVASTRRSRSGRTAWCERARAGDAPRGARAARGGRPRRPHDGDRQGALRRRHARGDRRQGARRRASSAVPTTSTRSSRSWRRDEPLPVEAPRPRRRRTALRRGLDALGVRRPAAGALARAEGRPERPRRLARLLRARVPLRGARGVARVRRRPAREARGAGRHGVVRDLDARARATRTRRRASPAPRSS